VTNHDYLSTLKDQRQI